MGCNFSTGRHSHIIAIKHLVALATIILAVFLISCTSGTDVDDQLDNSVFLLNLPANRWVKYHEFKGNEWWRKSHAGLAYDSTRGSLLVFGSDTHEQDWDNVIHEFIPRKREWVHHGVNAAPNTYRVNAEGYPVAGDIGLAPWAMHTYDGVSYDPIRDAVVVVGSPDHNPIGKKLPTPQSYPIWIYQLKAKKWTIFDDKRGAMPHFFGAATAYDEADNNLYICKEGLWALNLAKEKLEKIGMAPNCLHSTMAFDSWRRRLYIFGSYKGTSNISSFDIGYIIDDSKSWIELTPGGDRSPAYSRVPVAFDEKAGVFLLVVDDSNNSIDRKPSSTTTFIYDPETNIYEKLNDTELPAVGMNFMMAWDKIHEVFFLLTGNWEDGISVWAMRLARK